MKWASGVAAAVIVLFAAVNMNSSIAYAMSEVPVSWQACKSPDWLKNIRSMKIRIMRKYKVPAVEGLGKPGTAKRFE